MDDLIERLRRTKTERLMRSAFGGILLDMEEERQAPVNPDGPEAADALETQAAEIAALKEAMKLQMDERHKSEAEAKLWFEKAQEWQQDNSALKAQVERLEDTLTTIAHTHGNNPSDAMADMPRADYLAYILMNVRKSAHSALGGEHAQEIGDG